MVPSMDHAWKLLLPETLDRRTLAMLKERGIKQLRDEVDGEGSRLTALRVTAASREEALDRAMAVFDECEIAYSYFAVSRTESFE